MLSESWSRFHPCLATDDPYGHVAPLGELEGVRQEVGQDLAEPLWVGDDVARESGVEVNRESEALVLGQVLEVPEEDIVDLGHEGDRS